MIQMYNKDVEEGTFYGDRKYLHADTNRWLPVWYMLFQNGAGQVDNIHLSVANIGRSAYSNTMGDMLKQHKP